MAGLSFFSTLYFPPIVWHSITSNSQTFSTCNLIIYPCLIFSYTTQILPQKFYIPTKVICLHQSFKFALKPDFHKTFKFPKKKCIFLPNFISQISYIFQLSSYISTKNLYFHRGFKCIHKFYVIILLIYCQAQLQLQLQLQLELRLALIS